MERRAFIRALLALVPGAALLRYVPTPAPAPKLKLKGQAWNNLLLNEAVERSASEPFLGDIVTYACGCDSTGKQCIDWSAFTNIPTGHSS